MTNIWDMGMDIVPSGAPLGAEIRNIDLSKPLDDVAVPLIDRLARHIYSPPFRHTHKWQVGDLLMWDNCAVQHIATFQLQMARPPPPHVAHYRRWRTNPLTGYSCAMAFRSDR